VQEELHDYYRLLAVLEQELQITSKTGILSAAYQEERRLVQRPADLQSHRRSGETGKIDGGNGEAEGEAGAPGLTLLRLRAWLQEPIERSASSQFSVLSVLLWIECVEIEMVISPTAVPMLLFPF
jgi:hypothetical protein